MYMYVYIYMGQNNVTHTGLLPKAVVQPKIDDLKVFRSLFFQIDTGIVWDARRALSNEPG